MLLNRLQLFIFCLLFVTFIYHITHSHSHYSISKPSLPPTTYFQPIYFPVLPIHITPLQFTLQVNESKAYRAYKRRNTRIARRKYKYSSYHHK